jgi:hypothetical protein
LIANYVASIRQIILRLYTFVAPLAIFCFVFLVRKQQWGAVVVAQMLAALLVSAWFARVSSSYCAVLILAATEASITAFRSSGAWGRWACC